MKGKPGFESQKGNRPERKSTEVQDQNEASTDTLNMSVAQEGDDTRRIVDD